MEDEARELLREEMAEDHLEREMERAHVAHEESDEPWKDPAHWEGRDDG